MIEIVRPPIVTILGHVDHGKTSLLDYIRKTNVVSKEHGGITQHIGAYQITVPSDKGKGQSQNRLSTQPSPLITFIDTPGHAAFEKMRGRGAKVADIAILVVAIDDGVMPQTVEAIKHIQTAKVPIIVAINKIDLPGIDKKVQLQKIKKQLSDHGVIIEEYGGESPLVEVSAKTGEGVDKLLEIILLVAEIHELKGDPEASASGVVIESNLDKFKGPIATLLIRNGTLKKGDQVLIGGVKGRVRGMFDHLGQPLKKAGPSTPVEVLGFESVPDVGAELGQLEKSTRVESETLSLIDRLRNEAKKTLKVVIKADKQGSLEAIEDSLQKFNEEEKLLEIVQGSTGDVTEGDIKLAQATGAVVLGFNVKVSPAALKMVETEKVLVRTYNVIYELVDEMEEVIEGMVRPGQVEEILGKAEILAEFPHSKEEKIAGCRVLDGVIAKGSKVRVVRDGQILGEAKIKSLKKVKEEVQRVDKGSDCGIVFDPQIDFAIRDIVESYRVI